MYCLSILFFFYFSTNVSWYSLLWLYLNTIPELGVRDYTLVTLFWLWDNDLREHLENNCETDMDMDRETSVRESDWFQGLSYTTGKVFTWWHLQSWISSTLSKWSLLLSFKWSSLEEKDSETRRSFFLYFPHGESLETWSVIAFLFSII